MVPEISNKAHEDRLKEMELSTLEQRSERGDVIMLCKLFNKIGKLNKDDLLLTVKKDLSEGCEEVQLSTEKC